MDAFPVESFNIPSINPIPVHAQIHQPAEKRKEWRIFL